MQEAKKGSWATVAAGGITPSFGGACVAAGREIEGCYGAGLEERGDGHGGGRFDDDFHALPGGAHGGDETIGVCRCRAKGSNCDQCYNSRMVGKPEVICRGLGIVKGSRLVASERDCRY